LPDRAGPRDQCPAEQAAEKFSASYQGIALQLAEKLDVALDFGWRSGLPLR